MRLLFLYRQKLYVNMVVCALGGCTSALLLLNGMGEFGQGAMNVSGECLFCGISRWW